MDILVLAIWLMGLMIAHILLLKFLEMRRITTQLVEKFSLDGLDLNQILKQLGLEQVQQVQQVEEVKEEQPEQDGEITMEEELMNYVYNYQSPELDENDKKITIDEVSNLSSRLTPTDASNIIASYSCGDSDEYESYNDPHDQYIL